MCRPKQRINQAPANTSRSKNALNSRSMVIAFPQKCDAFNFLGQKLTRLNFDQCSALHDLCRSEGWITPSGKPRWFKEKDHLRSLGSGGPQAAVECTISHRWRLKNKIEEMGNPGRCHTRWQSPLGDLPTPNGISNPPGKIGPNK